MPIATPEQYAEMFKKAKEGGYAFPAINCTSSSTINAAIKGFADAGSDGIIQFSTGGAEFGSGLGVKDMVTGAVALAEFAHVVAAKYDVTIGLHTDHCPKDKLDSFVRPLIAASTERVKAGGLPIFQSHMWDGSAVPLEENLQIADELFEGRRVLERVACQNLQEFLRFPLQARSGQFPGILQRMSGEDNTPGHHLTSLVLFSGGSAMPFLIDSRMPGIDRR